MSLNIVPMETEHVKALGGNGEIPSGASFAAINKAGEVIACAGVIIRKDGIGDVWAMFSEKVKNYKKEILQRLIAGIDSISCETLRSYVSAEMVGEVKFIDRIGFKKTSHFVDINGVRYFQYLRTSHG